MAQALTDSDWNTLLDRISTGSCTPFLGAGASAGSLPLGGKLAKRLARQYKYPMKDTSDLAKVAQFIAIDQDARAAKEQIIKLIDTCQPPNFNDPLELHSILAELPLPVYLTTNYDDFMLKALMSRQPKPKEPHKEAYRWNDVMSKSEPPSTLNGASFQADKDHPIVYHLHGHKDNLDSMVLTEDDYLDFLASLSDGVQLPPRIQLAISGASLLFIGYRLQDLSFRVIHRALVANRRANFRSISFTVQFPAPPEPQRAYLDKYFGAFKVRVYWGKANEFVQELGERWRAYSRAR